MSIYRDWTPQHKIGQFARRHGLTAITFNPPNEKSYLRVWFPDTEEGRELEARARQLYGRTRGGHTA